MKDWSFRGEDLRRGRQPRAEFDPVAEGAKYDLATEVSSKIWKHACLAATDRDGNRDELQAQERFHVLAARIQARGGRLHPDAGKVTQVEAERFGASSASWNLDRSAAPVPGRTTLVDAEAQRRAEAAQPWETAPEVAAVPAKSHAPAAPGDLTVARETGRAQAARLLAAMQKRRQPPDERAIRLLAGVPRVADAAPPSVRATEISGHDLVNDPANRAPQPGQIASLDPFVGDRMSRLFDMNLRDVVVIPRESRGHGCNEGDHQRR